MTNHDKFYLARLEAHIAIWGNIGLFLFKFYVGIVTGSVAIMADAWHTLSDSLSSLVLLIGVKVAARPPDQQHPYGHGRAELIAALVIGVMLAAIGLEFAVQGVTKLWRHESAEYGMLAVWAMIVTIVVKEAMAQYAYWAGRKTGMTALTADGHHHRSDAISSVVILIGIIFGKNFWWVDGALALVVAGFIFAAALRVLMEASDQLLGRDATPELVEQLRAICAECHGHEVGLHHVHVHSYGGHREVTFHILLDGQVSLDYAHECAQLMERTIEERLGLHVTIHMEPRRKTAA